jgi:pimeloyl-ACP methyl ester carboxylesterase
VCTLTAYPNTQAGETWTLKTTYNGASAASNVGVTLTSNATTSRSITSTVAVPPTTIAVTVSGVTSADLNSLELWKNGAFVTRVTNPGTSYTFTGLTTGQSYRVDGYATDMFIGNTGTFTAAAGTNTKSIAAPGQGSVGVTVHYSDGSTPLSGASVALVAHSGTTWRTCTTNSSGVCTLTAYPNTQAGETWTLKTTYNGASAASNVGVTLTSNTTTSRSITTTVTPPASALAVTVTGVAAADLNSLELWKSGVFQLRVTNPGTTYTFTGLAAGQTYRVDAYATDMMVGSSGSLTATTGTISTTIITVAQGTVGVKVLRADAVTPLESASIALFAHSGKTWRTCTTAADGTCSMSAYPNRQQGETWSLTASYNGAVVSTPVLVMISAGASSSATIVTTVGTLPSTASLAVTSTGVAAPDLNSLELWKNGVFSARVAYPGTSYTFASLTAGQSYRVDAYATDMLIGSSGTFVAQAGTNTKNILAPAQGTIGVTVLYADGVTPLPGAGLALVSQSGKTWRNCTTGVDGLCSLTAYPNTQPAETWNLVTSYAGATVVPYTSVALKSGTTVALKIVTPVGGASAVTVTVAGIATAGDLNALQLYHGSDLVRTITAPSLTTTFSSLLTGETYRIDAYATDMFIGSTGPFVASTAAISKVITAASPAAVTARVLCEDGVTPLPNAEAGLMAHTNRVWHTCRTDSDGRCTLFVFANTLSNERWSLFVRYNGVSAASMRDLTLAPGLSTEVSVTTNVQPSAAVLVVDVAGVDRTLINRIELWSNLISLPFSVDAPQLPYTFLNLIVGSQYEVRIFADDVLVARSGFMTLPVGSTSKTISVPAPAQVVVKTLFADGATPLPGVTISAGLAGKTWRRCETALSGQCALPLFAGVSSTSWNLAFKINDAGVADDQSVGVQPAATIPVAVTTNVKVPSIRLDTPRGGERWTIGSKVNVAFTAANVPADALATLSLSTDSGKSWTDFTSSAVVGAPYALTVPPLPSAKCRMRVRVTVHGTTATGVSDGDFSIVVSDALSLSLIALEPDATVITAAGRVDNDASHLAALSREVVGAAADGVTRVLLRATTNAPGIVTFSMRSATASVGGLTPVDDGAPVASIAVDARPLTGGVYIAVAEYRPPLHFPASSSVSIPIELSAHLVAQDARTADATISPFQLMRVPVLFVHGLASSSATWTFPLASDDRFIRHAVDYSGTALDSFSTNAGVLLRGVRETLVQARAQRVAATQVDVVAHSMGGLLSRMHVSSSAYKRSDNYFAGDFHKLITVDTPHSGSEVANKVERLRACRYTTCIGILDSLVASYPQLDSGAVNDLAVGSAALRSIGPAHIPSHAIVGSGGDAFLVAAGDTATAEMWAIAPELVYSYAVEQVTVASARAAAHSLFHGEHDLIVGVWSQYGGMGAGSPSTDELTGPGAIHTKCTNTAEFSTRIAAVLDADPSSAVFSEFSPAASAPASITIRSQTAPSAPVTPTALAARIEIDTAEVVPGQTVHVLVRVDGVIISDALLLGPCGILIASGPTPNFTCTIPLSSFGALRFSAFARSGGVTYLSNAVSLPVRQSSNITSIRSGTPLFILRPGETAAITVVASYSDGVERPIPASSIRFQTSDSFVATIDANGLLQARNSGHCVVQATLGDMTATIDVAVEAPPERRRAARP